MLKIKIMVSVASLVASLAGLCCLGQLAEPRRDSDSDSNCCDYFDGKVVETSEDSIWLERMEGCEIGDVEWGDVSRVEIAKTNYAGEPYPTLEEELKNGDVIRVTYNGNSLEWKGDEAFIGIVFAVYRHPLE